MSTGDESTPACTGPECITCSDTAVGVTVAVLLDDGLALVDTDAGTREEVSVALVDAAVGDRILVHAGEAIGTERSAGGASMGTERSAGGASIGTERSSGIVNVDGAP